MAFAGPSSQQQYGSAGVSSPSRQMGQPNYDNKTQWSPPAGAIKQGEVLATVGEQSSLCGSEPSLTKAVQPVHTAPLPVIRSQLHAAFPPTLCGTRTPAACEETRLSCLYRLEPRTPG